ncbi:rhodanese [Mucilaginibacter sp. PPCGB 2223]|uniref:rhodanese-like domain-containing protein n=1 Tax=Mucilaginibacter sp. PPCGB 2223 TaxID=1886027 RepID=UPI000826E7B8|nr:rhodanese-like domain-containing protein [Mucilaginibacter sp. PPCGB 2223]OCX52035.1 rhodanese [Mucilaginibacter sp. PPCGB 2223]
MRKLMIAALMLASLRLAAQEKHTVYVQKSPNKIVPSAENAKIIITEVGKGKALLIDVRTPDEYQKEHLKYARNIDIRSAGFADQVKKLSKDKRIYLYCHSGNRSGKATDSLQTLGYRQSYNIGALDSLAKYGFPVEKKEP